MEVHLDLPVMFPVVVVGLVAENVLNIYLIVDLLSSSVVPVMVLGLLHKLDGYWTGWEVVGGGLGGILGVWIFGTDYYNSGKEGARLLLISNGLYVDDWSTFGAFVVAPFGGLLVGAIIMIIRLTCTKAYRRENSLFHRAVKRLGWITGIAFLHRSYKRLEAHLVPDYTLSLAAAGADTESSLMQETAKLNKNKSGNTYQTTDYTE